MSSSEHPATTGNGSPGHRHAPALIATATLSQEPESEAPVTQLQKGEALLAQLRLLENRATEYNNLAMKVYSQEQACVKELAAQKKLVAEYLKSAESTLKENRKLAKQQKRQQSIDQQAVSLAAGVDGEPANGNGEGDDSESSEDSEEEPIMMKQFHPRPVQARKGSFGANGTTVLPSPTDSMATLVSSSNPSPVSLVSPKSATFHTAHRVNSSGVGLNQMGANGWSEMDQLSEVVAGIRKKEGRIDSLLPQNAK
ncbi:hypothetical protein HDU98_007742 [Podochytrium sp. JEL0797]|nr:hypothetical protein HDU98_007742 [Podochytrium sp. JEL0797]